MSNKGGDPGFVRVLDEQTLASPSHDGNGRFLSLGNALVNPHVGLLFIDFTRGKRLRVHGEASVAAEGDALSGELTGAQVVVRVRVREVFPNCPRYIQRMSLQERSSFVPRPDATPPIPNWKRSDWACDVLPAGDPARLDGADGAE